MDFIKDQNPTALYEVGIRAGEALPKYVKEASMLQEEDVANLADSAFADRHNRLHPIHTKEAAFMSAVYLAGNGDTDSEVFLTVKRAAEFYGIEKDIDEAIALLSDEVKSAAAEVPTEKFALSFNIEDQSTWEAYPINSQVEVVKAATEVVRDWVDEHIPTDWLHHAAINIVKRANELNIHRNDIPEKIWEMGSERLVDLDNALAFAQTRKQAGVTDVSAYELAVKQAASGEITAEQAVDQWMMLDAENGVSHRRVISPQEAFYSGVLVSDTEKLAAENIFISDILIPTVEFKKLAANNSMAVRMSFRKEVADKIASVLEGLRVGDAKSASEASAAFASLSDVQRKELLNLLLQAA